MLTDTEFKLPEQNQPIYDELDSIYVETTVNESVEQFADLDPIFKEQLKIANDINEARKTYLELQRSSKRESLIKDLAKTIFGRVLTIRRPDMLAILKQEESDKVGSRIFGNLGKNEIRRDFFFDGIRNELLSWFFHQEVIDSNTKNISKVTLHYEVGPNGILRISSDSNTPNTLIDGKELDDFLTATNIYHDGVMDKLYSDSKQEHATIKFQNIIDHIDQTDDKLAA